ncbi:MAG: nicotinate phosphoribosyltransferase [Halomonas sp.]|jgi:nicotinate phosphoribosyltransferase|uniref:Nicotinate phosphoribosyltransferase n=1 Tax=Vreelandella aquamarina TaxID=77097 RepID=A0A6F8SWC3_9GAMM|nr:MULTISPECIES: nicotinate phosphoribosyltransferase [Halomonas]MEC8901271.1 nicotinate phosphoribosyltransferase [Pseudomonadota bacterium]MEC9295917.1 nicotinate phosphoribosyltransferase [Pseudomonadota bacterium]MEE3267806.1 nicotinate phosphoribosyltransferase [Pseudomonadota bacterium]NQY78400.1 nicotinate phosphoribosyltransferase [Halomonas sp.]TKJ10017.1 nicotinate phosphoribosyltransferase [Halomonas sp. 15WGF]|tara:strand:- start:1092 stop:2267 length:1176 start_codon:yes stop_codon:yes gene_type:complete
MLTSLLDNDFYKITMQNAVIKRFPYAHARYAFINRGEHAFPEGFGEALRGEVDRMATLRLSDEEKRYLQTTCPYLDPTYLDFLAGFRYDPSEVTIEQQGSELSVVMEGPWYRTILWEVPLMALISELWYHLRGVGVSEDDEALIEQRTREKIELYRQHGLKIAEFGTRRRFSFAVHDRVVKALRHYGGEAFSGTSNVLLAMRHGVKPIGTHAHEWFMFHGARFGFKMANSLALEHWVDVYRGDLGIALTDTFTTRAFFESFDKKFAKLFDGVRHDSGDPIEFADATIAHYQRLGINPLSKTIIFSDALTPEKVERIRAFCQGRIGMAFGIGTNFTNDIGVAPMNMVIKMVEARPEGQGWLPVVKLSDVPTKNTGDPEMIALAKKVLSMGSS